MRAGGCDSPPRRACGGRSCPTTPIAKMAALRRPRSRIVIRVPFDQDHRPTAWQSRFLDVEECRAIAPNEPECDNRAIAPCAGGAARLSQRRAGARTLRESSARRSSMMIRRRAQPSMGVQEMSPNLSRRGFLMGALAAGVSPAVGGLAAPAEKPGIQPLPGSDKLTAYAFGPQIWIRWADDPVTCYRAHPRRNIPISIRSAVPSRASR